MCICESERERGWYLARSNVEMREQRDNQATTADLDDDLDHIDLLISIQQSPI